MVEISVSLLTIERKDYVKLFYDLETAKVDYFHIDVMDGKFVENNTMERMENYTSVLKNISNIPLDIHLMVEDVKESINEYLAYEPNIITFHYEAIKEKEDILELIEYLKKNNTKVGIAINPSTKIEEIFKYLPLIHMVLVMSVEPGKGKQKLIPETIDKIKQLKEYIEKNNIEVSWSFINNKNNTLVNKDSSELKDEKKKSYEVTIDFIKAGNSIKGIAKERKLSLSTVMNHIEQYISEGNDVNFNICLDEFFNEDEEKIVLDAIDKVGYNKLKSIKEIVPNKITYDTIKAVILKKIINSN